MDHTHIFDATPEQSAMFKKLREDVSAARLAESEMFTKLREDASAARLAELEFIKDFMKNHDVGILGHNGFSLDEDGKHFVARTIT
jgi:hypothetical protein